MQFWSLFVNIRDAEMKNFIYYYYTDPDYQWVREAFREYMSNEL